MSYGKKCFVSNRNFFRNSLNIFTSSNFPLYFNEHVFSLSFTINIKLILFNSHCSAGYHHCSRDGWMSNYDSGTAAMEVVIMFS